MNRFFWSTLGISVLGCVILAAGCNTDNGIVGGACKQGLQVCSNKCVDLTSDVAHCGDCTTTCQPGVVCTQGVCGGAKDASPDSNADSGDGGDGGSRTDGGDGGCEPPFDNHANCGACSKACLDTEDCIAGPNATFACGPKCTPPLVACRGICVDVQTDPTNCGSCGRFCVSFLCAAGKCSGSNPGDVTVMGHDFEASSGNTSQSRVLSNAVFLPRSNPLRILSYEEFASVSAVSNVKSLLKLNAAGRVLKFTTSTNAADVAAATLPDDFDVVLMYDQRNGTAADLAARGASWKASLRTFTQKGGAVVALDGGKGNGAMPTLLTASDLLVTTGHTVLTNFYPVSVVSPLDVIASQVVSPYAAFINSVELQTTELSAGDTTWVVRGGFTGTEDPVVVHKIIR